MQDIALPKVACHLLPIDDLTHGCCASGCLSAHKVCKGGSRRQRCGLLDAQPPWRYGLRAGCMASVVSAGSPEATSADTRDRVCKNRIVSLSHGLSLIDHFRRSSHYRATAIGMRAHFAAFLVLACFACAAAVKDGPRLRETALAPALNAASVGSQANGDAPERVAGYFRLDRTYAAEMFYFYFQARFV